MKFSKINLKMMKKLIISFTILLGLFFTSCEDMLVESPKSLVVEDFYNTPAEVEAAIAAIIAPARGRLSGWWISTLDSHTEWGHGNNDFGVTSGSTFTGNFGSFRLMQGLDAVGAANVEPNWNAFYQGIRNANLVIANVPESEQLSQEQKDIYVAEARFFRAFFYFQLVRPWGGVPLYTENNLDQTTGAPKATAESVYNLITDDLEFAENNLPDSPPVLGRASTWTAKTLLADVYFFQHRHSEAADKAREVIESGNFSLEVINELDDFYNLFGLDASSDEEIFYIKYNQNSTSGLMVFTQAIDNEGWFGSPGFGIFPWRAESVFYSNWDDDDLRKHWNWYETANQPDPGVTALQPKKYNAPGATSSTFDLPAYRYADVLLIYAEASARVADAPTVDGMEMLNMVHRRAYGYSPNQSSPVDLDITDYNLDTFIDRVIQERGYEFQFEGKRWFDLVRAGVADEIMMESIGRGVNDTALLWPIPSIEFDLNEAMDPSDQNPGY